MSYAHHRFAIVPLLCLLSLFADLNIRSTRTWAKNQNTDKCVVAIEESNAIYNKYGLSIENYRLEPTGKNWKDNISDGYVMNLGIKNLESLRDSNVSLKVAKKIISRCSNTSAVTFSVTEGGFSYTIGVVRGEVVRFQIITPDRSKNSDPRCSSWGYECDYGV
jgi:hypothetical protein